MRRAPHLTLLLLFVGSGCSALIYEVVWLQLLQLVIGSTAVSLAVLLGTFMGGMCVGSLLAPRVLARRHHPLRAYALIEAGIGALGLLVYLMVPWLGRAYASLGGLGPVDMSGRALLAALCLLPPTVLMGATLPVIARWVEGTPEAVPRLGLFYAGNIGGAVFGALLAGFYLLRVHDMLVATLAAAGINILVAGVAVTVARGAAAATRDADAAPARPPRDRGPWPIYVAIGLSGATALGAEVIWTRLLTLLLGGTTYTFSIIVAVFLAGLGLGSAAGAALVRRAKDPRRAFGFAQLGIGAGIAWAAYMIARTLPYWPMPRWLDATPWITLEVDLPRSALALLPATLLWGASFPLALAAVVRPGDDPARAVGGLYAANTLGAILGATLSALVVVQGLGTRNGQRLLVALTAVSALLVLAPRLRAPRAAAARTAVAAGVALAALLAWRMPGIPPEVVGYGRFLSIAANRLPEFLYVGEGRNASIAVSEFPDGKLNFHVSGKVEASTDLEDMRLQRMLGHLAALAHPAPRSVLVVGFGSGVTAGTFLVHPEVERIVIVEIEPLIPAVVGPYFDRANLYVLDDPRVEIVYDDARHYLLTTDETFDVITSDPIHPWVKGSAALYTREYFELVKRRLEPGGVVTQWVPLYESSPDVVRSELATFFEAFPNGSAWTNHAASVADPETLMGYDLVLLGPTGPVPQDGPPIRPSDLLARLVRPDHQLVSMSLWDVELTRPDATSLIDHYLARGEDLAPWLTAAQINRDRNLRLQYLAGMGLDARREVAILDSLRAYRR